MTARARRRRCFYNGKDLLACYIASRSDIDDVVPMLTAFQIEWNKLHTFLQELSRREIESLSVDSPEDLETLAGVLRISFESLYRLVTIWGDDFIPMMGRIHEKIMDLEVQLFSGSLNEYRRATRFWWDNIERRFPGYHPAPRLFHLQQHSQHPQPAVWLCAHSGRTPSQLPR